jgi:hypothetical protein
MPALYGSGATASTCRDERLLPRPKRTSRSTFVMPAFDPKLARLTERPHAAKIPRLLPVAPYDTI